MNNQTPQTPQTALVTGATGFLGTHLCNQLLKQGWQVYALCRSQDKAKALTPTITIIIGDVLDTKAFQDQLPKKIDAIFHTAASTNTWFKNNEMQTNTNINGTRNMLDLALKLKVEKYVHISSVVVFGIHKQLNNIVESMPKAGKDSFINYLKTKTASEEIVLNTHNVDSIIINPTHIIGPGDKNNWARLIKMIAAKKLPSIPNGAGSFVDVRDVAEGIIQAYHHGQAGHNYLLGGTDMNFKEFITKVANKLKVKPTNVQLPNFLLMSLAHLKNLISRFTNKEPDITPESVSIISDLYACDSAKAKADLNYKNRDFDVTLEDTINFLKREGVI